MMEQTLCSSGTITHWALASNQQRTVRHVYDTWLLVTCPDYLLQTPIDSYVGLCFHIVWCNAKGVGDREIMGTYVNSVSKNTLEKDIFPHGTKSLLTSVSGLQHWGIFSHWNVFSVTTFWIWDRRVGKLRLVLLFLCLSP